jgi:bacterial/archaeal transporter family protein
MPQWVPLAILSALFAALVPILGKRGLAGLDAVTATALRAVVMAVFLGALAVARSGWRMRMPIATSGATWIALSGLAGALSWLCYFSALETGPATGVVALDRTSVIFAVILAAIFLTEQLTIRSVSGALLIAVGATLIAWK